MNITSPIKPDQWLGVFFGTVLAVLVSVFAFTYAIDPFAERSWIVEQRFKPIVIERTQKYNYIFNQNNIVRFDSLILGSSRAMKISPHRNPKLSGSYNFAISMATNREKLFILTEWLKHKKPHTLYLGVDFLNFHRDIENPDKPVESGFMHGNEGNYLSHYAFKMSIKALKNSINNKPETFFEKDGSINYFSDDQKILNNQFDFSQQRYKKIAAAIYKERFIDLPYIYTPQSLEYLRQIKQLCEKNNIKLVIFIPPEQIEATKMIVENPHLYNYYKRYKRDTVELFGTVYDFSGGWEENKNRENFYDVWHYRSVLGDKMLQKFEGKKSFGTILTPENIDMYLTTFPTTVK